MIQAASIDGLLATTHEVHWLDVPGGQGPTSINPGAQRGPNTDPGLPGETGVSGDSGTVYGIDGLKCG